LAVVAAEAGLKVTAVDLDPQQRTRCAGFRRASVAAPSRCSTLRPSTAQEALEGRRGADL
jgi:hypothetical protein